MSVVKSAVEAIDWTNRELLVACSGGLDSTVLLHALVSIGLKPEILHVNYGLRGSDSESDEAFVRSLASGYGLAIQVHHCPKELLKGKGINLQAAARDFRRQLFNNWKAQSAAGSSGAVHVVVLGHHADDQIETFFLQLFRGAGTFGLGGMYPDRDGLIRPFLAIAKSELRSYATTNALTWREDKSNESNAYVRNVWRNELLPDLLRSSPTLRENVLLMMGCFREHQQDLKAMIEPLTIRWKSDNSIETAAWKSLQREEQMAFAQAVNLPFWAIDRMTELCDRHVSSQFNIGDGQVIRGKNRLIYHIDRSKTTGWDFKIEDIGILPAFFDKGSIFIDPGKLKGELNLRPWENGDRIQSVGLNGSQLVSDILKDAGIPFSDRAGIQVLTDGVDVLWIPGLKVGKTALAGPLSTRVWRISVVAR